MLQPDSACWPAASQESDENPLGLDGFEFVEFTSTDPHALAQTFTAMGFTHVATHRIRDLRRYAQGGINLLVNMEATGRAAAFLAAHGPSANAMAFRVKDAGAALSEALRRGARTAAEEAPLPTIGLPALEGIGDAKLYLIDAETARKLYEDEFVAVPGAGRDDRSIGLHTLDHLTHNVGRGRMKYWAEFYENIFNFHELRRFEIQGQLTGLYSKAMTGPDNKIRIPINESQDDHSQIEEFLRVYRGEGIQHIAFATDDIFATVDALKANGITLQDTPERYYDQIDARLGAHGHDIDAMRRRRILIDGAPETGGGILLQIFTETLVGPIFFEIIQRKGNEGFGEGNFKALFESIETDQMQRGVIPATGLAKASK
jgi:4-hydroxyphenylpyruvate dioxygenase